MPINFLKTLLINNVNTNSLSYLIKIRNNIQILIEVIAIFFFDKDIRPKYKHIRYLYEGKRFFHDNLQKKKRKKIIFMNDWDINNGIGDRIKGILTTYSLSKEYDKDFSIIWSKPFPLTLYLEPANFDWRMSVNELQFIKKTSSPLIMRYNQYKKIERIEKYKFKKLIGKDKELHVNTNYNLFPEKNSILFHELFKPSKFLKNAIDKFVPSASFFSYSFRFMQLLGDFEDNYGEILNDEAKEILIESCLKELSILLQDLPKGYKALVNSDSKTFLKRACKIDPRIFCIDGEIIHPYTSFKNYIHKPDIYLKTFVDFFMIMNAERVYRLQTDKMYATEFPNLAAQIGQKPFINHRF